MFEKVQELTVSWGRHGAAPCLVPTVLRGRQGARMGTPLARGAQHEAEARLPLGGNCGAKPWPAVPLRAG